MTKPVAQDYYGDTGFDDQAIQNDDIVYRYLRTPVQVTPCEKNGLKISDQAFKGKKTDRGVSIDIKSLMDNDGVSWHNRYGILPNTHALMSVKVKDARAYSNGVAWTPKPIENSGRASDPENPYHGEILHPMTPAQARALQRTAITLRKDF